MAEGELSGPIDYPDLGIKIDHQDLVGISSLTPEQMADLQARCEAQAGITEVEDFLREVNDGQGS